ncbi:MAG: TetR/AcrR family transcriptional regulator [Bacilli bacterium]|nr:TetR/AcrR family transcriptional regulator [Bacilli bacterium]
MKVKKINKSSIQTAENIKSAFAELLSEKNSINNITVVDIVKKAGIARSSFYTHYDSINDVIREIQDDTLEVLTKNTENIKNLEDVDQYLDEVMNYLKENEDFYSLLLQSNEPLYYVLGIHKIITKKLYETLLPYRIKNLELNVDFFTSGATEIVMKYFRKEINTTLEEINIYMKEQFKKIFFS